MQLLYQFQPLANNCQQMS